MVLGRRRDIAIPGEAQILDSAIRNFTAIMGDHADKFGGVASITFADGSVMTCDPPINHANMREQLRKGRPALEPKIIPPPKKEEQDGTDEGGTTGEGAATQGG